MKDDSKEKKARNRASTLRIVGGYLIFGVLWIVFSDQLLFTLARNPDNYLSLQTYKGIFYVVLTTILLLALVKREFRTRDEIQRRLEESLGKQEELRRDAHHRVKNSLQTVQSIISLQRGVGEAETVPSRELLRRLALRLRVPALFHEKMYNHSASSRVDPRQYLLEISKLHQYEYREYLAGVEVVTDIGDMWIRSDDAIPLGFLVNELLLNGAILNLEV
ncbi:MAG TPA: sensor histidine kinase [Sediminispirochaeta sp.]|nr:sensor histidine kinase [Sediminispirochaeta sp.]